MYAHLLVAIEVLKKTVSMIQVLTYLPLILDNLCSGDLTHTKSRNKHMFSQKKIILCCKKRYIHPCSD